MDSLVSVIIPNYNDAHILHRAIASTLQQKYLHEVIIVDDCSTDNSLSIAEKLCELDPRIAIFSTPANSGPASARNFGAQFATGHYLSFLDSDDEYLPNFLEVTVDVLEKEPDMSAVKTGIDFVDERGQSMLDASDPRIEALTFSSSINMVLNREAFERIGGFPVDSIFRKNHGGEDVAFNKAVAKYLEPLGRLSDIAYRAWNKKNSHLERFLANTRVDGDTFEFISLSDLQQPGGPLEQAIDAYLNDIATRFGK